MVKRKPKLPRCASCLSASIFFNIWLMNLGKTVKMALLNILVHGTLSSSTVKTLYSFMDRADNNNGSEGSEGKNTSATSTADQAKMSSCHERK